MVRSRDVVFVEDQTIEDIDKAEKPESQGQSLIDLDPVPLTPTPGVIDDEDRDEHQNDAQVEDEVDVPEVDVEDHHEELAEQGEIPLRRFARGRIPSTTYSSDEYVLLTDGDEPECYQEAVDSEEKAKWVAAMNEEMQSLYENETFELVKLPKGRKALKNLWVYKVK